jgi:putative transcriptional regulator
MNEHGEIKNQIPVLRAKKGYSQKDVAETNDCFIGKK